MARNNIRYVCQDCGADHVKWNGRCDDCGAWNSLVEDIPAESPPKGLGSKRGNRISFVGLRGKSAKTPRLITGISEFDRVCGGGLVSGSALLVGGDPGIGKSTLLLQVIAALSAGSACVYISGEESIDQLRLRASRLGLELAPARLAVATSARDIVTTLDDPDGARVVVIDSIQTMYMDSIESAPGTVSQVRTSAQELIRLAKRRGFCLLLVGHVTKDGQIAGPRVLEHMVDTVLYFEGERGHQFRILRSVKNRFGPTDEIGVFEMTDSGLHEVANPSAVFLGDHDGDISGASVFAGIEGTRPLLVEIQALVSASAYSTPRRAVVGWDSGRLAMVLAVLETRAGLALGNNDIYLNVAGGLKITEPAADLAVAAALVSAAKGVPVPSNTIFFGEIGLSGEVRSVTHADARIKEAEKLGFSCAVIPSCRQGSSVNRGRGGKDGKIDIKEISHVSDIFSRLQNKSGPQTVNKVRVDNE